MKKLMILAVLAGLAACNTVAGVGEDISSGAHKVGSMMGG
jgi:predicted small secreted protein